MVVWKDKYCIELKDLFNRMCVKDRLLDKNKGSLSFIGRMKDRLKEKTKEQVLHSGFEGQNAGIETVIIINKKLLKYYW